MSDSNHLSVLPKKPLLEGRNFFVQLIFLVLFVLLGTIVFSSAGLLLFAAAGIFWRVINIYLY